jgi:hypothetical protein
MLMSRGARPHHPVRFVPGLAVGRRLAHPFELDDLAAVGLKINGLHEGTWS